MNAAVIAIGGLLLAMGLVAFSRSAVSGLYAVMAVTVIEAWFLELPAVRLGLQIYLQDVLMVALLLAAVTRFVNGAGALVVPVAWYLFGLLMLLSFALGVMRFGTLAGVDFRNYFYFWAGAFYLASFPLNARQVARLSDAWIYGALALLMVVVYRWIVGLGGVPLPTPWVDYEPIVGLRPYRVINSAQAAVLGLAVIMLVYRLVIQRAPRFGMSMLLALGVGVLVLQHRSVWALSFLGIASLMIIPGVRKGRVIQILTLFGLLGAVVFGPFLAQGVFDKVLDAIASAASRAADFENDTSGHRIATWVYLLGYWSDTGLFTKLIGEPFGGGYAGLERAPHNFYIQTLFRVGVLGLACVLVVFASLTLALQARNRRGEHRYAPMLLMLLFALFVFYLPYSPAFQHGLLLGIAMAIARRAPARSEAVERADDASATPGQPPIPGFLPR